MENNFQSGSTPGQPASPQPPVFSQSPKKSKKGLWIGLAIAVIVLAWLGFAALRVMKQVTTQKNGASSGGSSAAADKLYDALGNAVGQQKLQVAMLRATYANRADADAGQHKGSEQSSVAAMETATANYANVFAFNPTGEGGGFTVGRCVGKVPYAIPDAEADGITTLQAAAERLKQPLPQAEARGVTDSCVRYGSAPGALIHLAWARLSDGIMPVTYDQEPAKDWANKMKGTGLFTVTDEGIVKRDGQEYRKYAFKPKVEANRIGVTLTEIFEQSSHIEELKRQNPNAIYDYPFIPLSATIGHGAEGFYLVNEKTNLPAYSEINSISKDMVNDGKAPSRLNLVRSKQIYSYPSQLKVDLNTPLEILE